MAIVKCLNPQCDYFQKPVPEGDFCPFCGESLDADNMGRSQPYNEPPAYASPSYESSAYEAPPAPPMPAPSYADYDRPEPKGTVVEPIAFNLNLVHTASSQQYTIQHHAALDKVYLGRHDGLATTQSLIDLYQIPYSERISRFHAYISWDANLSSYAIVDDSSTNGTILNGRALTPKQSYPLKEGDRLELGREHKVVFTIKLG